MNLADELEPTSNEEVIYAHPVVKLLAFLEDVILSSILFPLFLVGNIGYYIWYGKTLGLDSFGLKILDEKSAEKASLKQCLIRLFLGVRGGIILYVLVYSLVQRFPDYPAMWYIMKYSIWISILLTLSSFSQLFNKKYQSFGDRVAGTVIVAKKKPSRGLLIGTILGIIFFLLMGYLFLFQIEVQDGMSLWEMTQMMVDDTKK